MRCILLPTGARLSAHPDRRDAPPVVRRAGLLVQIMVVYVLTGLKKTSTEWFDGTAF